MTKDDIVAFATGLPGVVAFTASEANGAPEVSWGDSFFFYDPDGDPSIDRQMPFATIVTNDYDGSDTASDLNRPGVFRLNIGVGRPAFEKLIGYPPRAAISAGRLTFVAAVRGIASTNSTRCCWVNSMAAISTG